MNYVAEIARLPSKSAMASDLTCVENLAASEIEEYKGEVLQWERGS
jgi:hypothetical protein